MPPAPCRMLFPGMSFACSVAEMPTLPLPIAIPLRHGAYFSPLVEIVPLHCAPVRHIACQLLEPGHKKVLPTLVSFLQPSAVASWRIYTELHSPGRNRGRCCNHARFAPLRSVPPFFVTTVAAYVEFDFAMVNTKFSIRP